MSEAPPWLTGTYLRSAREVGASAPDELIVATAWRLLDRWCDQRRTFHTVRHLVDMLTRIDQLAGAAHQISLVRLAAFYHGAVFDPPELNDQINADHSEDLDAASITVAAGNWENHQASAHLAEHDLFALGITASVSQRVAGLIENLEHLHVPPADSDAAVLVDAAIGQLSVDPQRYQDYLKQVRVENSGVDVAAFVTARMAAMRRLLARERLFSSPSAVSWEAAARDNVLAELAREQAELDRLASQDG